MSQNEKEINVPVSPTLSFEKSPDYKTLYVNWVQAGYTPFDVSLVVGQALASGTNVFDVELKGRIIFHPAEAKIVMTMLAQTVANYEAQFGEIAVDKVRNTVIQNEPKVQSTEGV